MTTENKAQLDAQLHEIAAEIEGLMLSGKTVGVCAIVITDDGMVHTRMRYIPGGRIPMLAGTVLVQHQLVELINRER